MMWIVWMAFTITAVLLAVSAWVALRSKGELASVFHIAGKFLLVMAIVTVFFPALLPLLGVQWWVGSYCVFVSLVTFIMTAITVAKARQAAKNSRHNV
jgi:hypothetical protein